MIDASVIVPLTRPRGLDLTVSGLLGQVRQDGWESRQVVKNGRLAIDPFGAPIYKRYRGQFELIAVDVSSVGKRREDEVAGANHAIDEAGRQGLTSFDFTYDADPGAEVWKALRIGFNQARGRVIIFLPELSYPPPHFVATCCKWAETAALFTSSVVTRRFTGADHERSDYLGLLLDPRCKDETRQVQVEESGEIKIDKFTPALQTLFGQCSLFKINEPMARGFELSCLALGAMKPLKVAGDDKLTTLRLAPFDPDPKPDLAGYSKIIDEVTAVSQIVEERRVVPLKKPSLWQRIWR